MRTRLIETSREAAACIDFWHEVYRQSPCWVPPDRHHFEALLIGRGPAAENARVQTMCAEEDGRMLASVTAVRHETYIRHKNEQMGHLLFFEALPGRQEAVDRLMEAACDWLRSIGCQAARLSLLPGWQLPPTIDAYEAVPTVFHTYNPPYYHGYVKNAGFRTEQGCVEYQLLFSPELAESYQEMVRRASDSGIQLRAWDFDRLQEETELFTRLFNDAFRSHWGFMPLPVSLFQELTVGFGDLLVRDFLAFAMDDGQPVGFVYSLPDLNQAFHRMKGKLVEEDFQRYVGEIDHGVLLVIGVNESHRGRGVNLALAAKSYLAMMARGYKSASYTVVLDDNWPSRRTAEKLGARVTRNFNIYRRELGA
jgi:ribosomal protein S18 acetylase RimI-like enzyme